MRLNLSRLQRTQAIVKRKELYEALHPETKAGKAGGKADHPTQRSTNADSASVEQPVSFVDDTASKTGRSKRSVQVDAQIGSSLTPDEVSELQGTPAENNQSVLLRIAQENEPERRRTIIDAAKESKARAPKRNGGLESVHKGLIKCFAVVENWLAEDAVWRGRKATPEEYQGLLVELAKLQSQIGKFKRELGKEYGRR